MRNVEVVEECVQLGITRESKYLGLGMLKLLTNAFSLAACVPTLSQARDGVNPLVSFTMRNVFTVRSGCVHSG